MAKIKRRTVLNQLKEDLIGKDSHRGVTLTYSWLANQFGHIALGFIPSFILHDNIQHINGYKNPVYASFVVTLFWFLFELYNFLGPLLKIKPSSKKEKYTFNPNWSNISYDTITDVAFFAFGAFLYSFYKNGLQDTPTIVVLTLLSLYLLKASSYWYLTKMYQHYANYPFQFRLSQWNFNINNEDKKSIFNFIEGKGSGNHLLIFGSQFCGKTSLGVGVLNELSIKHKVCLYTSAMKLFSFFYIEENTKLDRRRIWSWKECDYLVIDDLNPGKPIDEELINPKNILRFLDPTETGEIDKESCSIIANKNIIWVLGNKNNTSQENNWLKMLLKIGVNEAKIEKINLID
ncbi:hypothetical protein PG913_01765 [Tenacibaculum pacificus]|uniref:hypothetical protein n=1 Tax=Tenacibaculum pacificus TaxID=3018314 RepID=UPI0022F3FB17|nr:hypothetical protein [Tenacibaculum pacificus]WBX73997.1 hypothetical protein PG913_01765 [Tenacibaculum pacificus]